MGEVLRAVSSLEMFTLIAPNVCERMVAEGAVPVLFHFLSTSNRSVPSQKMVGHGLRALLNIAKLPNLREALCAQAESTNCLAVLVELAQGYYRDKAHHAHLWDVLALLAELLLRGPADWRKRVLSRKDGAECVKRLESVLALLSRGAQGGRRQPARPAGAAAAKKGAAAAAKGGAGAELAPKCIGCLRPSSRRWRRAASEGGHNTRWEDRKAAGAAAWRAAGTGRRRRWGGRLGMR